MLFIEIFGLYFNGYWGLSTGLRSHTEDITISLLVSVSVIPKDLNLMYAVIFACDALRLLVS